MSLSCCSRRTALAWLAALASTRVWPFELPDLGGAGSSALSEFEERRLGREIMRQIRAQDPAYFDDPALTEYLTDLLERLAQGLTPPLSLHAFALTDPTINAFALPGGYMGFHFGLIAAAEDEAELAAVAAHELAHVAQRHIAQMFEQQKNLGWVLLGSLVLGALAARSGSGQLPEAVIAAGQAGVLQQQLSYSRAFEHDADRQGLLLLARAGFDPEGAVRFFQRLLRATRTAETGLPPYLRTHPLTVERIAELQQRIDQPLFRAQYPQAKARMSLGFAYAKATVLAQRDALPSASDLVGQVTRIRAAVRRQEQSELQSLWPSLHMSLPAEKWRRLLEAEVLQALGRLPHALAALTTALQEHPRSLAVRAAAVRMAAAQGKIDDAWSWAQAGARLHPNEDLAWRLVGEVAAVRPDAAWAHRAQGERLALEGRWQEAYDQFQRAIDARRNDDIWGAQVQARANAVRQELIAEREWERRHRR